MKQNWTKIATAIRSRYTSLRTTSSTHLFLGFSLAFLVETVASPTRTRPMPSLESRVLPPRDLPGEERQQLGYVSKNICSNCPFNNPPHSPDSFVKHARELSTRLWADFRVCTCSQIDSSTVKALTTFLLLETYTHQFFC